jgi:transport and Golgi organization protein 2
VCTVTAIPRSLLSRGVSAAPLLLRVAHNRDERLTRAAALPPSVWAAGSRRVLMPIDPESGGTWIAANDAGVVFALLNANPETSLQSPSPAGISTLSRGTIVPSLVESATVSEALARVERIQVERYAPFRLLLFDRFQLVECVRHGRGIRHRRSYLSAAIMRTSSGLGDAVVAGPRRALFQRFFSDPPDARAAQDMFHQHRWIGREALSINMLRSDARTVSHTIIEVGSETISMSYVPADSIHPVAVHVAA